MGANYQSIIFFVAIIGVFYFLIIRPQKKRQTEQVQLMNELKPGAEIQTIGGIYGQIVSIDDDDRVVLAVYDGSELEIAKRAIARIVTPTESDDLDDDVADEDESAPSSRAARPMTDSRRLPNRRRCRALLPRRTTARHERRSSL